MSVDAGWGYLLVSAIVSATATWLLLERWIPVAHRLGFTGVDRNKPGGVRVAEMGGVWVAVGSVSGILVLLALYRYREGYLYRGYELFGSSLLLFMASFIGLMDDLMVRTGGLRRIYRIMATLPIAAPLVVIKAGVSRMDIPLLGPVDLGLVYPLILVPVGVMGAANAFNMLAGYNGLEAGMGLLLMIYTAVYSYAKGVMHVFYLSMIMAAALAAFLRFNWYPARVFPGNTFTYGMGAYYAALVILGNFEKFGLALYTLYFLEFLLFIRGKLEGVDKENFGKPVDGRLKPPYKKAYSVTHIALKILDKTIGATETRVTILILAAQAAIGALALRLLL